MVRSMPAASCTTIFNCRTVALPCASVTMNRAE
jgi:hypothetical protein